MLTSHVKPIKGLYIVIYIVTSMWENLFLLRSNLISLIEGNKSESMCQNCYVHNRNEVPKRVRLDSNKLTRKTDKTRVWMHAAVPRDQIWSDMHATGVPLHAFVGVHARTMRGRNVCTSRVTIIGTPRHTYTPLRILLWNEHWKLHDFDFRRILL